MSFKRALTITFALLMVILVGLVASMKKLAQASESLAQAEQMRHDSLLLARRLQQSSENLTRTVRSYVATGNAVDKQYYHQILAIRHGNLREPVNYDRASWGWEKPLGHNQTTVGPPISMENRLRNAECTPKEVAILQKERDIADQLLKIELSAIQAIDHLHLSPSHQIDGRPARDWALEQVHGEEYRLLKEAALTQIDTFIRSVEHRTSEGVTSALSHQRTIQFVTWSLALLAVLVSIAAYFQITKRVVQPLTSLSKQAEQVATGKFTPRPAVDSYAEIESLALSFDQMANAIQQDINRREKDKKELISAKHSMEVAYGRIKKDINAAAKVQRSLLPDVMPEAPGFDFAYSYLPCEELAGDTLNVLDLDDEHIALYLVDVSGHGVQAALLAATLSHLLSPIRHESSVIWTTDQISDTTFITPPARVAEQLNTLFPYDPDLNQYFTLHYGILNKKNLSYRFVSCGHPKPVLLRPGEKPRAIQSKGPGIGLLPEPEFEETEIKLLPADRIFFFSDGVLEAPNSQGHEFQDNGLYTDIGKHIDLPIKQHIQQIFKDLLEWSNGQKLDDISAVAIEVKPDAKNI